MHKKWNPDPDYLYIFRILRFASNSPGTNVQSEELENPLRKTVKSLLFSSTNRGCFHNENKNKIKNNATPGSFLSQSLSGIGQNKIVFNFFPSDNYEIMKYRCGTLKNG